MIHQKNGPLGILRGPWYQNKKTFELGVGGLLMFTAPSVAHHANQSGAE